MAPFAEWSCQYFPLEECSIKKGELYILNAMHKHFVEARIFSRVLAYYSFYIMDTYIFIRILKCEYRMLKKSNKSEQPVQPFIRKIYLWFSCGSICLNLAYIQVYIEGKHGFDSLQYNLHYWQNHDKGVRGKGTSMGKGNLWGTYTYREGYSDLS